jgi:N-acetylglucosamine-6-phosphate deacetylase
MDSSAEAFRSHLRFPRKGGTTSLLLTTATAPLENIVDVLKRCEIIDLPIARLQGVRRRPVHLESKMRRATRAEIYSGPITGCVRQLLDYADVIKRVTIAPELPGALEAIESFRTHGVSVSGGHSDAWDEDARSAFDRGMRSATHTFNCMSNARRRGVCRVGGLLEFALSEPQISCELIADGQRFAA